jgi:4a-hydroxytetrahydrobiopterin dehydratase
MNETTTEALRAKKCVPCEGGVPVIGPQQAQQYLRAIPAWTLAEDGKRIWRTVKCKHFVEAVGRLNQIAELAEQEQHHPDLHLTGYRQLRIELTTHAIGGLSENDFIVAAKIDPMLAG